VATEQLTLNNKIVGVPLMYDGLSLYYNKEMLKAANVEPPKTWAELKALADSLTVPSNKAERGRGTLQRAGLAIGNATNVEHFSDIFGLLVLQNGGDLAQPNSTEVRDALLFYTNFVKEDKVWSDAMPSSTVAFSRGDVAMMFAPSWRALDIKAMNPELDFGVAPLPQLSDKRLAWASYWAEGVNAKSKNQTGAWTFIKFLSEPENLEKFYSAASQVRTFGEPYSRTDMAGSLSADPILGALLSDAPVATSWYLNSFTHDNGLNDQLIKYYGDAINATLDGTTVEETLETLDAGVTQVLRQYNAQ
jgi:multiple sugar transport system substrate-binding protein